MDEQFTGRQIHKYRSRIAALTTALQAARPFISEFAGAGNPHAAQCLKKIDKALAGGKTKGEPE